MIESLPHVPDTQVDVEPPHIDVIGVPAGMEDEPWEGDALDVPEYVDPDKPHPSDIPPPPEV